MDTGIVGVLFTIYMVIYFQRLVKIFQGGIQITQGSRGFAQVGNNESLGCMGLAVQFVSYPQGLFKVYCGIAIQFKCAVGYTCVG